MCFFFMYSTPTWIYTLSLHDALPILKQAQDARDRRDAPAALAILQRAQRCAPNNRELYLPLINAAEADHQRSEEHTSELQSHSDLVCRLLLEKKKKQQ